MSFEITILSGVVSLLIGYIFGKMYQESKRKHRVPKARNPMPPPPERGAGDDYPVIEPQNWK